MPLLEMTMRLDDDGTTWDQIVHNVTRSFFAGTAMTVPLKPGDNGLIYDADGNRVGAWAVKEG